MSNGEERVAVAAREDTQPGRSIVDLVVIAPRLSPLARPLPKPKLIDAKMVIGDNLIAGGRL